MCSTNNVNVAVPLPHQKKKREILEVVNILVGAIALDVNRVETSVHAKLFCHLSLELPFLHVFMSLKTSALL
jgi:hypothetical protein